ncbi:6-phosphofructokinase [Mycolicibacterium smegmatis MC2 155]|uniref:6-phosphofructokinase n=1 Tax=Mycolicibacterium smegmatis (strain ATCC 700084 / mc(2)155) TaxID=246196 RepID=I7GGQ0_MYCS2|nr:6-phosphofructokinase [Mycolicibacterium smegmatis MC2 155]
MAVPHGGVAGRADRSVLGAGRRDRIGARASAAHHRCHAAHGPGQLPQRGLRARPSQGRSRGGRGESPGTPLDRHELDSLYELTLTEGLTHGRVLLSGPQDDRVLPADLYRRLSTDLGANGCKVAADLAGERLEAVLAGHPSLIKVSHEELLDDGRAKSDDAKDLVAAMRTLREDGGACTIVVSRAGAAPALALFDDDELGEAAVVEVVMPKLEPADPAGAGDSMTAGMVAALARGRPLRKALQIGAACGALNVVRHGLGTGGARAVETLADRVELRPWK